MAAGETSARPQVLSRIRGSASAPSNALPRALEPYACLRDRSQVGTEVPPIYRDKLNIDVKQIQSEIEERLAQFRENPWLRARAAKRSVGLLPGLENVN